MAKKYVPTGYQIIDLGEIESGTYTNEPEILPLIKWLKNKKRKPLVLSCVIDDHYFSGLISYLVADDNSNIRSTNLLTIDDISTSYEFISLSIEYDVENEELSIGLQTIDLAKA